MILAIFFLSLAKFINQSYIFSWEAACIDCAFFDNNAMLLKRVDNTCNNLLINPAASSLGRPVLIESLMTMLFASLRVVLVTTC